MKTSISKKLFIILLAIIIVVSSFNIGDRTKIAKASVIDKYEMRGLTAFQLVSDMGPGWNLGNTLDAQGGETNWGNPKTTKAMIDTLSKAGVHTLRIPVRWDDNYTNGTTYGKYTIKSEYLKRVEEVVNYGLDNGMYVIINIHHNKIQTQVSTNTTVQNNVMAEIKAVWTQVANHFKKYGDHLIFEIINEPRYDEDWSGNSGLYEVVNKYNETGRAAIRATGGNNVNRLIMMPTYCASSDLSKIEAWKKSSTDKMIAVSIHAYLPWAFAFDGKEHSNWQTSDETELEDYFSRLYNTFIKNNIPVVIGEFGATDKNGNTTDRAKCISYYTKLARSFAEQDIPCCIWDNGVFTGDYTKGEIYGIFNRNTLSFSYGTKNYTPIINALTQTYIGNPSYESVAAGSNIIDNTSHSASAWGQTNSFSGSVIKNIKPGEKLVVTIKSGGPVELIFQNFSNDAKKWVKFQPTYSSATSATWDYNTISNAIKSYGVVIDKAYIGVKDKATTVSKVEIVSSAGSHTHNYNGTKTITLEPTTTTYGREKIACSVNGCSEYKIVLIDPIPTAEATSIKLNSTSLTIATKASKTLTATVGPIGASQKVTWTSSDPNVASVDSTGKIVAKTYGKCDIIAKTNNGLTAKCSVQTRFYDVNSLSLYYYNPVYWAADNNITRGYNGVYFGPDNDCTRREMMIFLWRIANCPSPQNDANIYFNDLSSCSPTSDSNKAIAWGYESGIVKGYVDGSFGINRSISRLEALIMLYRVANKPETNGEIEFNDVIALKLSPLSDSYNAILWGSTNEITKGYSDNTFRPKDNCLRQHIVTFLYRYNNLNK